MRLIIAAIALFAIAVGAAIWLSTRTRPGSVWLIATVGAACFITGLFTERIDQLSKERARMCEPGTIGNLGDIPENVPFFKVWSLRDESDDFFTGYIVVARNLIHNERPYLYWLNEDPPTYFRKVDGEIVESEDMPSGGPRV